MNTEINKNKKETMLAASNPKRVKFGFLNVKTSILKLMVLLFFILLAFIVFERIFGIRSLDEEESLLTTNNKKVEVEIYYEVLCPDSRYFLLKQLYPTWEKVNEIMDIHFKPYGKASQKLVDNSYEFKCQHGPTECLGNMVHACAITHIKDTHLLVQYIKCMIEDNYDPLKRGQSCANSLDLNFTSIQRCVSNREGPKLLAAIGEETHNLRPKVSFIPTILLNGSQEDQRLILKDLLLQVCRKFKGDHPKNCIKIL